MEDIIRNAYIEIIAGIAQFYSDGGIISEDEWGNSITIAFPNKSPEEAVVRSYYESGEKRWESRYHQGEKHGIYREWYKGGARYWEVEYNQGVRHGKSLGWYQDGSKHWKEEYCEGRLCDNGIIWDSNGERY